MKKGVLLLLLVLLGGMTAGADETAVVWSRIYRDAVNLEHRLAIMDRIVNQNDRRLIPVMDEALGQLILLQENLTSATEQTLHQTLVNMIVRELGILRAIGSAPRVYRVMELRNNGFQEALAVISLADMGAVEYTGAISERLRTINLGVVEYTSREEIETLVEACVYALERLKQPEGYESVFFASLAGYSSPVLKKINRALVSILDDPTDILITLLIENRNTEVKIKAVEEAARSGALPERIAEVAMEGLNQGLTMNPSNRSHALALSRLRITSAEAIRNSGFDSIDASGMLRIMLTRMYELNEILTCLEALGTQKNDMAAKALADFLQYHNTRPADLRSPEDYRIVLATIAAMGNTGNPLVIPQLIEVPFRDWNREVRQAAEEALAKLGE
ncbi:MAG: HEAT repeat domain-containing protein [Spirochaetales bacterium]|nr:HEAT repeat domain-containing protein [Spirochaetales bacterium]